MFHLPSLAICCYQFPLLITVISKSENSAANKFEKWKKWLIIILKGFIKLPVIKQSATFLSFCFLIDYCMSVFFLFLYQRVSRLWKIDKIFSIKMEKIWKYWYKYFAKNL